MKPKVLKRKLNSHGVVASGQQRRNLRLENRE
jgi:hypothetical protein